MPTPDSTTPHNGAEQRISADMAADKALATHILAERKAAEYRGLQVGYASMVDYDRAEGKKKRTITSRCDKVLESGNVGDIARLVAEARLQGVKLGK